MQTASTQNGLPPPVLTVAKAALRLGISESSVRNLARNGKLPSIRYKDLGNALRFRQDDLAAFEAANREGGV